MSSSSRLFHIQHLRLLAAFLVLVGHALHEVTDQFTKQYVAKFDLGIGVDIFFIISGFIMLLTSRERFGIPGGPQYFMKRRVERVVPIYWVFTTLMLAAIFVVPSSIDNTNIDAAHIIGSYFFFPVLREDELFRPILALGWTLNYEMFFYLAFAGCMFLPRKIGPWALAAIFGGLALANPWISKLSPAIAFWSDPIVLEFVAGMGLAAAYLKGIKIGRISMLTMMALSLALAFILYKRTGIRAVDLGVPAALFCAGWILGPPILSSSGIVGRALGFGGDASYALYLSHPFTLNLVALALAKLGMDSPWVYLSAAIVGAMVSSAFVYIWIERPIMQWFARRARNTQRLIPQATS